VVGIKVLVGIGVKVWGGIKVGVVDLIGNPVVTVDATFSIPSEATTNVTCVNVATNVPTYNHF
jgi:hypothetical protein